MKTRNLARNSDALADVHNYSGVYLDVGYNGDWACNVAWWLNNCYYLLTKGTLRNIHTTHIGGTEQYHKDLDWTDCNCQDIASAHWYVQQSWDFFDRNPYNWFGVDDDGSRVIVGADDDEEGSYIGTDRRIMLGGQWLQALDVAAHEFTHGVTYYTSGLQYQNEPGALNESFSDIFGVMVERYIEGNVNDWQIGEDGGNPLRSLQNPKGFGQHFPVPTDCDNTETGQPDTYQGQFWHSDTCDNGGVHVNSGVQNHWFYLLAAGGSGTNDNGDTYNVQGIGIDKAARIAWYNLRFELANSSSYSDAADLAIQSAIDLYGNCSNEHIQTQNAWYAVGIGNESECPPVGMKSAQQSPETKIYPNPVSNTAFINFGIQQQRKLTLVSMEGKVLARFQISANQQTYQLDLSDYALGLYMIRDNGRKQSNTYKIVKQ